MLPLYNTKFGAFREIIISRATSGGRRETEFNSGSLPPIPGGLATLPTVNPINQLYQPTNQHHQIVVHCSLAIKRISFFTLF